MSEQPFFVPCASQYILGDDIILNDVIASIYNPDNLSLQILEAQICEGLLYYIYA